MRVLMLNGSPRKESNTQIALDAMREVFEANGVDVECVQVGNKEIRGCMACGKCSELGKCVFDDIVNEVAAKLEQADGLVIGSPVHYASAAGALICLLDRLFYSMSFDATMKVGAAVACARRGGTTATFDELNKYFTISGMPVASGGYWNIVHGRIPGEARQDEEGIWNVKTVAQNMTFLMNSIALGKEQFGLPEPLPRAWTHFI